MDETVRRQVRDVSVSHDDSQTQLSSHQTFCHRDPNYMTKSSWWTECLEPKNVVQFNMGLFITLMAASCLQVVLCVIQVINGLVGCLCGTGNEK